MDLKAFERLQNLRLALGELQENFSILAEFYALNVRAKRAYYDECIKQGFSKEEALALTRDFKPFGV